MTAKDIVKRKGWSLTFYHELEADSPGVIVTRKGAFDGEQVERLLAEVHGFGIALELVIE